MSRRSGVGEEAQLAVALLLVRAERPRAPGHLARLCIHVAARRPSPSRRDRYARGQRAGHPGLPAGRPRRGPGSRAAYAPCYAPDEAYRDRALFLGQLWAILTTPDHSWGNHLPLKSPDLWRSTAFRGRGAFGGRRLGFGLKSRRRIMDQRARQPRRGPGKLEDASFERAGGPRLVHTFTPMWRSRSCRPCGCVHG
jgi:hypothetical protein